MIVGTAGHIDHGKTSLVRALTGVDTDRLVEEKARGITIELGFAYLPRPGRSTIGFVDVPGHERFVHTMLAGASGIDLVLLVVAADDGVMPQTREHLAIVTLLGITRGIVALTKCDLAGPERRAEVAAEIAALLAPTALAGAVVVPVSTVTGEGIGELRQRLDRATDEIGAASTAGRFRLAVDRSFSLAGAGTVVTGTVLSGRVAVGDTVMLSPLGREARVRSIHAQNAPAAEGIAGQRCALALVGQRVEAQAIARGEIVLDSSLHDPVKRIDVRLSLLAGEPRPLSQWLRVKLHHASAERDARVLVLGDRRLVPGETGFAQIVLDQPLALSVGDSFVLRDTGATRTMGGGTILDLHPPERHRTSPQRRAELAILETRDAVACLEGRLGHGDAFVDLTAHFRDRAVAAARGEESARRLGLVTLAAGGTLIGALPATWARYGRAATGHLAAFHAASPDLPGLGQERLRLALAPRLPAAVFSAAVQRLAAEGVLVLDRSWVRLPGHEVRLSAEDEATWAHVRPRLGGVERFRPPRVRDIAKAIGMDEAKARRLFKLSARRGDVDEIAQDHFFLSSTVIEMADIARGLADAAADGQFSVIEFRDRLQNGRKVAIQILEFFDRQGLTMRRGDIRRINPHRRSLFTGPPTPGAASGAENCGGETSPVGRPDFKSGEGRETALGRFDSCLLRHPTSGESRR